MENNYDFICYFDGACEPTNPSGNMGIGAIIINATTGEVVKELSHYIGSKADNSNNVAEYQAFGWTITQLLSIAPEKSKILIHGDSKLVIEQMNGKWGIKSGFYKQFADKAKGVLFELKKKCDVSIVWIPREKNQKADELSKKCMIENGCEFRIQKNG